MYIALPDIIPCLNYNFILETKYLILFSLFSKEDVSGLLKEDYLTYER